MPGVKYVLLKKNWISVLICWVFLLSTLTSSGQPARIIHGMVVDSAGQPFSGAAVTLYNQTDSFRTFTNLQGKYTFGPVHDTAFTIRVEYPDCVTFSKRYVSRTIGLAVMDLIILTRRTPGLLELHVTGFIIYSAYLYRAGRNTSHAS
jgi:hypothetical protein